MSTGSNDVTEKSANLQIVEEQSAKEILETFGKWFVEKFKNSPASDVSVNIWCDRHKSICIC